MRLARASALTALQQPFFFFSARAFPCTPPRFLKFHLLFHTLFPPPLQTARLVSAAGHYGLGPLPHFGRLCAEKVNCFRRQPSPPGVTISLCSARNAAERLVPAAGHERLGPLPRVGRLGAET